jgi:CubicO group peptidase (beta-lactamase class C family)
MKMWRSILPIAVLYIFNQCNAQTEPRGGAFSIQHSVDSLYKNVQMPGILAGILNNGRFSYYTAGYADPGKKLPFDSATIFEIGSITKTFTAYVLTSILMQHQIPDTTSILKYLPDSVQQNQKLAGISFRSLMNHTSGLPRLPGNLRMDDELQPYKNYTASDLYTYLKKANPSPDGKSKYSNLGAGLAGVLAERYTGTGYNALLDQYIFNPLKLGKRDDQGSRSVGYLTNKDEAAYWDMGILQPAGGIHASAKQLLLYLQHMSIPSPGSKNIVDKLTTQTVDMNGRVAVALGWHILHEKGRQPVFWHNGGTYGFSTFCAFAKEKNKAVVVVINQFNKNEHSDGLGMLLIKQLISEE